jgi:hypothetical protein
MQKARKDHTGRRSAPQNQTDTGKHKQTGDHAKLAKPDRIVQRLPHENASITEAVDGG